MRENLSFLFPSDLAFQWLFHACLLTDSYIQSKEDGGRTEFMESL